ncbi:hypothetical protein AB5N19_14488 [Seiridium cardinale]
MGGTPGKVETAEAEMHIRWPSRARVVMEVSVEPQWRKLLVDNAIAYAWDLTFQTTKQGFRCIWVEAMGEIPNIPNVVHVLARQGETNGIRRREKLGNDEDELIW